MYGTFDILARAVLMACNVTSLEAPSRPSVFATTCRIMTAVPSYEGRARHVKQKAIQQNMIPSLAP